MLYGTNASKASGDGGDRDYAPEEIPGIASLGASSPMRRPAVVTSGGGFSPQGSGGGGGAGAGETAVNSSRVRSGFSPADRSTSIRSFAAAAKPQARQAFSKSGRGSKESPMSPSAYGLSGLDFGWNNLKPPKNVRRAAVFLAAPLLVAPLWAAKAVERNARVWSRPKPRPAYAEPQPTYQSSGPGFHPLGGLDEEDGLGFGWNNFKIGNVSKMQIIPKEIRNIVPNPIRKAIRYAGVGMTTVLTGGFIPQPIMRKTFGLSPGESAQSETALKVARGITTAVAVVATAGAAGYGPASGAFASSTPAASPLPGSYMFMGPSPIGASGAAWQAPTVAELTSMPLTTAGAAMTPGYVAPIAAPAASGGFMSSLVSGTGSVLKAVGINVGSQALLASMSKVSGEAAQAAYGGEFGAAPTETTALPSFIMPSAGGPSGGASGSSEEAPILAGVSPLIGLGLAGAALALYMSRRKKK